jgi:hypothetical protein
VNFWKDGIDLQDFEKLLLGFLLIIVTIIASVKYFMVGDVSENWVNVIMIMGGLFTVRKIFSYFKKDSYYSNYNEANNQENNTDNTIQG